MSVEALLSLKAKSNWAAHEAQFEPPVSKPTIDPEIRAAFKPFADWCVERSVRSLPAKPGVVRAYLETVTDPMAAAFAISEMHRLWNQANPLGTSVVEEFLAPLAKPAPRSWPAKYKAIWTLLHPMAREIIGIREEQRDKALRQSQNLAAAQQLAAAAAKKGIEDGNEEKLLVR
jgi:hypothetical protein